MSENLAWVPDACTLPTVEQPLRVAEFETVFDASLRSTERLSPTRLRLVLDPSVEQTLRELTAREAQCCSFFTFTYSTDTAGLVLDVEVPPAQTAVLNALARR
ncbi:MAG TPA: hypothetical protein VFT67_11205 [Jatrophihabitantaceae bacterium]|nr:hypothetical protein [Jatrophihabitantaceae bacterium]